ncbi:hypothetical protein AB4Z13_15970 [Rhizobium sp. YAF28]|uniref:hypothetical protein n=1 Tax=Rhizobium sp. YAF28 TaxID=3233081 RepID=UPI003F9562F5
MRAFVATICAIVTALLPARGYAEQTFATADIVLSSPENMTLTTIHAAADTQPRDGAYVFEGTVVYLKTGKTVPISVSVPADPTIAKTGFGDTGDIRISERFKGSTKIPSGTLNKIVYSIEGERSGSIVFTDDPIPVIVYLIVGAVTIALGWAIIDKDCNGKFESRTTLDSFGKMTRETVCTPA